MNNGMNEYLKLSDCVVPVASSTVLPVVTVVTVVLVVVSAAVPVFSGRVVTGFVVTDVVE